MKINHKIENLQGNLNLISNKEEEIVEYLKKNLDRTNDKPLEVHPKNSIYTRYIKRVLDIIVAVPIFLVLLPIKLLFVICTFFDVGHPIFYMQSRCGRNGNPFLLVKFRNMNNNTDENGRLLPANKRVTKFGKIMRKYSLDELLNFWSVIKGDMSIIGPRPLPVFFYDRMSERHKMRNAIRPGLECPRLIKLQGEDLSQYHIQFENDVWYVENVSFLTDIKLIFHLVKMVFSMRQREHQANGNAASYFVGYDEGGHAISMSIALKLYADKKEDGAT